MSELTESSSQSPCSSEDKGATSPPPTVAEPASRKKRPAPDGNARKPEEDHRKRRRNRTTQSCVNCHTSKRMCDRKRPCGRCTQLGLTGLCVYEVDDPNQKHDDQDEKSRLQKRVAELEGVIRELKNKPHPRWAHPGEGPEKWHARARSTDLREKERDPDDTQSTSPSACGCVEPWSDNQESCCLGEDGSVVLRAAPGSNSPHQAASHALGYTESNCSSPVFLSSFDTPSAIDVESPVVTTPREENQQPQVTIALPSDHTQATGIPSTSMISDNYLPSAGMDEQLFGDLLDSMLTPDVYKENQQSELGPQLQRGRNNPVGHCGCMMEPVSYSIALELTLRLRKAANLLGRSARHGSTSDCLLYRLVAELDAYVATTLGNMSPPLADSYHTTSFPPTRALMGLQPQHLPYGSTANLNMTSASNSSTFVTQPVPSWDGPFALWNPPR